MARVEWFNTPSTATPLAAANLNDLETRKAETDLLPVNVKDPPYNAVGNGIVDDTTAIQAAIDSVKAIGGTVFFPPGMYLVSAELNCEASKGVVLDGGSVPCARGSTFVGGTLKYTPSTGSLISGRSSHGLVLRGLRLLYSHASYAGDLVDFDWDASNVDPTFIHIEKCYLGGDPASNPRGARSLLRLNKSVAVTVKDCQFYRCQVGIIGSDTSWSNSVGILQNSFAENEVAAIQNPGEGWNISGNVFEPTSAGAASGIAHDFVLLARGLHIAGNWFGDVTTGSGSWISLKARGLTVIGNSFQTPGPTAGSTHLFCSECEGVAVIGNNFEGGTNGVNFGAVSDTLGVFLGGNDFQGVSNPVANTTNANLIFSAANDGMSTGIYEYPFQFLSNMTTTASYSIGRSGTGHLTYFAGSAGHQFNNDANTQNLMELSNNGDLSLQNVGHGFRVKEGTNAKQGVSTLVAGTVTVSTTAVTANSRIFLQGQNSSGTHGELTVSARTAGTSFVITSASGADTRQVAWEIFEPSA